MKLKIPPVIVAAVCFGLMWFLDYLLPIGFTPLPGAKLVAKMLLGIGVFFGIGDCINSIGTALPLTRINPQKPAVL